MTIRLRKGVPDTPNIPPPPPRKPGLSSSRSTDLLSAMRSIPDIPRDAEKRLIRLDANDWTKDDWHDLLAALRWVRATVAARHGFIQADNDLSEGH